ncbi:hypothetical protein DDI_4535 [Dickeya dianthicola RNS04.9]|nr:hypothetical protein DDI_4535 [Dickeya dianthicola RNS04.9]
MVVTCPLDDKFYQERMLRLLPVQPPGVSVSCTETWLFPFLTGSVKQKYIYD